MGAGEALIGLCLALEVAAGPEAGAASSVFLPTTRFTLAWTHSIERTRWEERYAVTTDATGRPALQLTDAAVRGSGAGMEPAPDAVLRDGWYRWQPRLPPLATALRLTRSVHSADYTLCLDDAAGASVCSPMARWLPSNGDVTRMWACQQRDGATTAVKGP